MSDLARAGSPTGLHPASSEEARAFLQQRIALFSKTAFAVSMFFFVGDIVIDLFMHGLTRLPVEPSQRWHLAAAGVALVTWLAVARAPRLAYRALVAIDAGSVLLALGAYALMSASVLDNDQLLHGKELAVARMDFVLMLVTLMVLVLRAVIVPASTRHTTVVGMAGVIPVIALSYWLTSSYPLGHPPVSPAMALVNSGLWGGGSVLVTAVASRVIYGLHMQVKAAERLGQYVLEEKIGEGGMGTVYRASHALLRRPTAVKLLPRERSGGESLSRFEREVQLTSRLTHPNTVAIYDYGHTPEGIFYYAMEYLEGVDLEQLVERHGPQSPARVVHLLAQVCGSLAEAHGIGLVHRDIKPANIILCERGGIPDVAKVVDFGLVKQLRVGEGDAKVTATDAVLGTPHYLAPEAIKDPEDVDARVDLYALGAVAYFLLTGSPVFDGKSVVEVCAKHLHEKPVPPSKRLGAPLPHDLESLVLRCLDKQPSARPQTATALRDALLACNVEPWTDSDAREWWDKHTCSAPPRAPASGALTVDLHERMPRGTAA